MRILFSGLLTSLLFLACYQSSDASTKVELLAHKALSKHATESAEAISELRSMGPSGLEGLLELYASEIERHAKVPLTSATLDWQRLSSVIDAVSQQKDAYLSRLYWYTDFEEALAASRASGKPILSLRLLGKLSEEYSCANSRFFRVILYPNAEISNILRERFILHWKSVRPAPRVTIDFGDGRKLQRTITGNSIHYILDSEGRVIDALPGLYGPKAFTKALLEARDTFERVQQLDEQTGRQALEQYHRAWIRRTTNEWQVELKIVDGKVPAYLSRPPRSSLPSAVEVAPLAMTKMVSEISILQAFTRDADALGAITDEEAWNKIAGRRLQEALLDNRSIGLIQRQLSTLLVDASSQIHLAKLIEKLQHTIALDTVRNEYMLRTRLRAWLIVDPTRNNLEAFNEKIYAELFLTPHSDPWLGLFSPEIFVALENGGIKG